MSTIILTHGTSYNRAKEIITNGFGFCNDTIWACSDEFKTYFYQVDKLAESEGLEDCELQYQIDFALSRSNESAQITSALEPNPVNKTIVFEIHIEANEEIMENIIPDNSCENMNDIAVCINNKILNDWVSQKIAKVIIHEFAFCSKISLCYLIGLQKNQYLQDKLEELSEIEQSILYTLTKVELPWDDLFETKEINSYTLN